MSSRWLLATAAIVCAAATCPAHAAQKISFDVPAGRLNVALVSFATQARISIDTSDPALQSVRIGGLKGQFTVREGLRRLLRRTGYDFRFSRGNVVRVFRQPARRAPQAVPDRPSVALPPSPQPPAFPTPPPEPIIVTASKRNVALADYPGGFNVLSFDEARSLHSGNLGSEVLLRELPNLTSTNLGSGRNKIFVRGIADSSFNGQLQSTISQYYGESRLTYSAPDPDLALYDIERVEIVEGPQGTLYGAGSLGGVIRIMPRPPKLRELSVSGTAAIGVTGENLGGDGAMVANFPIGERAAVRVVGYRVLRPGYIDDVERGLSDVNRTSVSGVRATFRMEFNERFTFDAGLVSQDTASEDGQYTDAPLSVGLMRRSFVAQPFDNDYRLIFGTLQADLGNVNLVSNTSYTVNPIETVFDATQSSTGAPLLFKETMEVKLLTHETRVWGSADRISNWVSGFSIAHNVNNIDRFLGPIDALALISTVRSETLDGAFFGEATLPLARNLSLTVGGRLSLFVRFDEFSTQAGEASGEPTRPELRFLPSAALSWKPREGMIGYLRYQEGFRPGADQLTVSGDEAAVTRFQADEIRTTDIGMRFGTTPGSRMSGGISYAFSAWDRVQADLVTTAGFPFVTNIGSAKVHYLSANLAWRAMPELGLELSGFYTTSRLNGPTSDFEAGVELNLPNIADSGARLSGRFEPRIGETKITVDGSVGYIGTSFLGVGTPFDISQGDYFDTAIGARADFGRWGLSLDIDNLLDSRANRFSYGNPFSVAEGNQRTPLRPRTVRIGIDARF